MKRNVHCPITQECSSLDLFEDWNTIIKIFRTMLKSLHCINVPPEYVWNGYRIGEVIVAAKKAKRNHLITKKQKDQLDKLGICWNYTPLQQKKWLKNYEKAMKFRNTHGHLCVGWKDDKQLGIWLEDMRKRFNMGPRKRKNIDNVYHFADYRQVEMLNAIDMVWTKDTGWEKKFTIFSEFLKNNPLPLVTKALYIKGINIGTWLSTETKRFKNGKLDQYKIKMFEAIGYDLNTPPYGGTSIPELIVFHYFKRRYKDAILKARFTKTELDCYSPKSNVAIEYDGIYFHENKYRQDNIKDDFCKDRGIRLIRIREKGLKDTKYAKCYCVEPGSNSDLERVIEKVFQEEFSMELDINIASLSSDVFAHYEDNVAIVKYIERIKAYYRTNGRFPRTSNRMGEDEKAMHVVRRAMIGKNGLHIPSKIRKELIEMGFPLNAFEHKFECGFNHAKRYFQKYGNLNVPSKYVDPKDEYRLGEFVEHTRRRHPQSNSPQGRTLTNVQINKLSAIGMNWGIKRKVSKCEKWSVVCEHYKKYILNNRTFDIPVNYTTVKGYHLGRWVAVNKSLYKHDKMSEEKRNQWNELLQII